MPGPVSYPRRMGRRVFTGTAEQRHADCPDHGLKCDGRRCQAWTGKTNATPRQPATETRLRPVVTERLPGYSPRRHRS